MFPFSTYYRHGAEHNYRNNNDRPTMMTASTSALVPRTSSFTAMRAAQSPNGFVWWSSNAYKVNFVMLLEL